MNAPATGQQWQLRVCFPCLGTLPLSRTAQRPVCREAFRQGPEPWDVVEPMQQSTAWQQRQQQQQQRGRQRLIKQRGQRGTNPSQLQQLQQLQAAEASAGKFSSCQTFQALYKALQAQVMPANSQPQQLQQADAQQGGGNIRANPKMNMSAAYPVQQQQGPQQQQQTADDLEAGQVEQPAQMQLRQLSARDCVGVVDQLGAIARSQHSSSSGSSTNPFVEDQALQQSLALVSAGFVAALVMQPVASWHHIVGVCMLWVACSCVVHAACNCAQRPSANAHCFAAGVCTDRAAAGPAAAARHFPASTAAAEMRQDARRAQVHAACAAGCMAGGRRC